MAKKSDIEILVKAKDLTGKAFGAVERKAREMGQSVSGAMENARLRGSVAMGDLQFRAIKLKDTLDTVGPGAAIAFGALTASIAKFSSVAGEFNGIAQGFERSFGDMEQGLGQLRMVAQGTISDMNLLKTANRAALLGVTDNVEDLSKLMVTARIRGREMGVGVTQAFNDIVTGIGRGSPKILDNLGIKIPDSVMEMTREMTEAERQTVLLQYAMQDGANIAEEYGDITLTAKEQQEALGAQLKNSANALGQALIPTMNKALGVIIPVVQAITAWISANPALVGSIVEIATVVTGVIGIMWALSKAIATAQTIMVAFGGTALTTLLPIVAILGLIGFALKDVIKDQINLQGATLDLGKVFDNTGQDFGDMASGIEGVGNSMGQALDTAKDKVESIRKAIRNEKDSYEEQLADIVRGKRDQIAKNQKALEGEEEGFAESMKRRKEEYNDNIGEIEERNAQRLEDLRISFRKSVQIGSESYQEDLENFKQKLAQEKQAGQARLEEEKMRFQQETQQLKSEYEERTSELQAKIDRDQELLNKHREEIQKINIGVKKDEIQQLKEAHKERLTLLDERLKKAKETANKEVTTNKNAANKSGMAWGNAFDKMGTGADKFALDMEDMGISLDISMSDILKGIYNSLMDAWAGVVMGTNRLFGMFAGAQESVVNALVDALNWVIDKLNWAVSKVPDSALKAAGLPTDFQIGDVGEYSQPRPTTGSYEMWRSALPTLRKGSDIIQDDVVALLHKGEKVVRAEDNEDYMGKKDLSRTRNRKSSTNKDITIINNYPMGMDANAVANRLAFQLNTL